MILIQLRESKITKYCIFADAAAAAAAAAAAVAVAVAVAGQL